MHTVSLLCNIATSWQTEKNELLLLISKISQCTPNNPWQHVVPDEAWFFSKWHCEFPEYSIWPSENHYTMHERQLHVVKLVFGVFYHGAALWIHLYETTVDTEIHMKIFNEFVNKFVNEEVRTIYFQWRYLICIQHQYERNWVLNVEKYIQATC